MQEPSLTIISTSLGVLLGTVLSYTATAIYDRRRDEKEQDSRAFAARVMMATGLKNSLHLVASMRTDLEVTKEVPRSRFYMQHFTAILGGGGDLLYVAPDIFAQIVDCASTLQFVNDRMDCYERHELLNLALRVLQNVDVELRLADDLAPLLVGAEASIRKTLNKAVPGWERLVPDNPPTPQVRTAGS